MKSLYKKVIITVLLLVQFITLFGCTGCTSNQQTIKPNVKLKSYKVKKLQLLESIKRVKIIKLKKVKAVNGETTISSTKYLEIYNNYMLLKINNQKALFYQNQIKEYNKYIDEINNIK